jgi:hypothetical protein
MSAVWSLTGGKRTWHLHGPTSEIDPNSDMAAYPNSNQRALMIKSFWGDERNFLGLLMRFACGDVRVLIVSYKNDHGPSRRRYRALQRQRRLKICFRESFGVVRFWTLQQYRRVCRNACNPFCQQGRKLWWRERAG